MEGAERCRSLPTSAGKWLRLLSRHFGRWRELAQLRQIAMVRKGSPVRVPEGSSESPAQAGFLRPQLLARRQQRSWAAFGPHSSPQRDRSRRRATTRSRRSTRARSGFTRLPLPYEAAFLAARCYLRCGKTGGARRSPFARLLLQWARRGRAAPAAHARRGRVPQGSATWWAAGSRTAAGRAGDELLGGGSDG